MKTDPWTERYLQGQTGWDIGYPSPALCRIIDNLPADTQLLIPGAGNGWEAEYAWKKGLKHTTVVDLSRIPLDNLKKRVPDFPSDQLICMDYFEFTGQFDLILEQTFFCAIDPGLRKSYVNHSHSLLTKNGVLSGLLFIDPKLVQGPPFGGTIEEYRELFTEKFHIEILAPETESIKPRMDREVFFRFKKR